MTTEDVNPHANVFSNRVLVNNWYDSAKLQEYNYNHFIEEMKAGKLLLARFRKMYENLNRPIEPTQTTSSPHFGDKVLVYAPHVPCTDPPTEGKTGLLLGGRIDANSIAHITDLADGCKLVGLTLVSPSARNVFVLTSSDYCDRTEEPLKYAQEFMLTLASSIENNKPLYVRYDPDPLPGLSGGLFPLYFSENPVSAARWRVLPIRKPRITRFEQEGKNVPVNTDVVINHCATNLNLGFRLGYWSLGFHGKVCSPEMRTCLNIYKCEKPNNIWQIYVPPEKNPVVPVPK